MWVRTPQPKLADLGVDIGEPAQSHIESHYRQFVSQSVGRMDASTGETIWEDSGVQHRGSGGARRLGDMSS